MAGLLEDTKIPAYIDCDAADTFMLAHKWVTADNFDNSSVHLSCTQCHKMPVQPLLHVTEYSVFLYTSMLVYICLLKFFNQTSTVASNYCSISYVDTLPCVNSTGCFLQH